jgi:TonB family protein
MEILKDQQAIDKYGPKGANGVVIVSMKLPNEMDEEVVVVRTEMAPMTGRFDAVASEPLILIKQIDGSEVVMSSEEYANLDRSRIKTVEVLGDQASIKKYTEKYGQKAEGGIVLISLKRPQELNEVVVVHYQEESDEPEKFYLVYPETMPKFQGGDMDNFAQWLASRIKAPCNHSGTVRVGFEVGSDGSVSDVKIMESVCEEIDAAVLSVISKSPKWEPATDGGKPVAQYLTIPIVFRTRTK